MTYISRSHKTADQVTKMTTKWIIILFHCNSCQRTVMSTGWHTHIYVAHHVNWFPPIKSYNSRWTKKRIGTVSATFHMSNVIINTVLVAIYQDRRRNKVQRRNHHHPTYRKDRSTEACMTVTDGSNQVVLDSSLCKTKTSVTLSHCWYQLTSLSKWMMNSDSGQFAAPPSSR